MHELVRYGGPMSINITQQLQHNVIRVPLPGHPLLSYDS